MPRTIVPARPKLLEKRTFRLPLELDAYLEAQAADRGITVNELILTALENDCSRLLTYRLSLYAHLIPLWDDVQRRQCPTMVGDCPTMSDTERNDLQ